MKKLISLSIFITLLLVVLVVKTTQAEGKVYPRPHTVKARVGCQAFGPDSYRDGLPCLHRYVWIDGYWTVKHPRRAVYIRVR